MSPLRRTGAKIRKRSHSDGTRTTAPKAQAISSTCSVAGCAFDDASVKDGGTMTSPFAIAQNHHRRRERRERRACELEASPQQEQERRAAEDRRERRDAAACDLRDQHRRRLTTCEERATVGGSSASAISYKTP